LKVEKLNSTWVKSKEPDLLEGNTIGMQWRGLPCRSLSPSLDVMTFGAPRMGNTFFKSDYSHRVPNTFRVVNEHDIVPEALPALPGYEHIPNGVLLTDGGQIHMMDLQAISIKGCGSDDVDVEKQVLSHAFRCCVPEHSSTNTRNCHLVILSCHRLSFPDN
jgi:hypothetical protein